MVLATIAGSMGATVAASTCDDELQIAEKCQTRTADRLTIPAVGLSGSGPCVSCSQSLALSALKAGCPSPDSSPVAAATAVPEVSDSPVHVALPPRGSTLRCPRRHRAVLGIVPDDPDDDGTSDDDDDQVSKSLDDDNHKDLPIIACLQNTAHHTIGLPCALVSWTEPRSRSSLAPRRLRC
jgi:hypothetical protein